MGLGLYILVNGKPEPTDDINLWGIEFEKNRNIKFDEIDGISVSTVFLGMDHSFGSLNPVLFETMVFGGEHDGYTLRYETIEEATIGHKLTIDMVDRRGFRDKQIKKILNEKS